MEYFRTSSYTIVIDLGENGLSMLIHGYTGTINIVSNRIANFLQNHMEFSKKQLACLEESFKILLDKGYITQKTEEEERKIVQLLATAIHKKYLAGPKGFMFLVTYNCNFRCSYCFEADNVRRGSEKFHQAFTKKMVDKAYDAIASIAPQMNKRHPEISLYGGEPLLAENKEIVTYILNKGQSLGYTFSVVTNGYEIDQYDDILKNGAIKEMQITVDGDMEWHNKRRIHYADKDTFTKIIENIGLALERGVSVLVRVNTDNKNIDSINELKNKFHRLGYDKYPKFKLYSALLRGDENLMKHCNSCSVMDTSTSHACTEPKLEASNNGNNQSVHYLSRHDFNVKHEIMNLGIDYQYDYITTQVSKAMLNSQKLQFISTACGVQNGYYIFDPRGDIYSCWDTVGDPNEIIGVYRDKVELYDEMAERWTKKDIGIVAGCVRCKYAFLCGGGCVFRAIQAELGNDMGYCDDFPYMFNHCAKLAFRKIDETQYQILS